jgi:hypothetical protein
MGALPAFRALVWKNVLIKRRHLLGTVCEFALPIIFLGE